MHPLMKNSTQNAILNYIRVVLSILIVLSTFNPMIIVSAASGEVVSISSTKVNPGDTANVTIFLENYENVTGMNLTLVYDQSIISLDDTSVNESVGSGQIDYVVDTFGTVEIRLRQLDNLTEKGLVPLIDLGFDALVSGASTLDLQNVELLGGETPSILGGMDDGYIIVEEIIASNNAPVLDFIGDQSVLENTLLTITLNATDFDDDSLTYSSNASFGTLTDSVFTWTPGYDKAGTYYVNFSVNDGLTSDSEIIGITVINVDQAPEFDYLIGDKTVDENKLLSFTISATDPDDDVVSYSANNLPNKAKLDSSTGEFTWRPVNSDSGNYYVDFIATANGLNDTETITIIVGNIDQPPIFDYLIGDKTVNETELLNFTISATDPDNDTVIYSAIGLPGGGSLDSISGYFIWTPDYDDANSYDIQLVATANDLNVTETITITVNNLNREPVLTDIGSKTIQENNTLEFTLSATDADKDDLSYYMSSGLPPAATLNSTTGAFSWTPDYESEGTYTVYFTVSDGSIDSNPKYTEIKVKNTNRAPEFPKFETINTAEDSTLTLNISAFDPDDDSLIYDTNVSFGIISGDNFIWTPSFGDAGTHYIEFTVFDEFMYSDTSIVKVEVDDVNRAPVLNSISPLYVLKVGDTLSFNLVASDPDDYSLMYNVTGLPESANSSLDKNTGTFSWTPVSDDADDAYNAVFTVSDGALQDSIETTIAVGLNNPPGWETIGPQQINESENLIIVLNGSSDSTITYFASELPTGSIFDSVSGTFSWTPFYNQNGVHYVKFGMNAGGSTITEIVTITVNNVNQAPSFGYIPFYTVNESEKLSFVLNATDPDKEDVLTFSYNVSYGSISDNVFTWTPGYTANQTSNGTYYINFTVTDDGGLSDDMVVIIHVNDVNAPPELSIIESKSVVEGKELLINLTATDVDKDILTYSVLNKPENATFNSATGVFRWTPVASEVGTTSLIFGVTDGEYNDTETVAITVTKSSSTSTTSSSSSGGGGGGGSLSSGEKYENIISKDYVLKAVVKDTETVFSFYKENNSIVSVSFTSKLNGGQVKAVVEMLAGTSSQVSSSAPGNVYENMNIYIDSKLGSNALGNSKVNFKVEKSWIDDKEIDISTMTLCRYSSVWVQLPTDMTGEDEYYYYFTSITPDFSPFAISSIDPSLIAGDSTAEDAVSGSSDTEDTVMSTEDAAQDGATAEPPQESSSTLPFMYIIALIGLVVIGAFGYKKRDYYEKVRMQIGNPDGKRYRRVK